MTLLEAIETLYDTTDVSHVEDAKKGRLTPRATRFVADHLEAQLDALPQEGMNSQFWELVPCRLSPGIYNPAGAFSDPSSDSSGSTSALLVNSGYYAVVPKWDDQTPFQVLPAEFGVPRDAWRDAAIGLIRSSADPLGQAERVRRFAELVPDLPHTLLTAASAELTSVFDLPSEWLPVLDPLIASYGLDAAAAMEFGAPATRLVSNELNRRAILELSTRRPDLVPAGPISVP